MADKIYKIKNLKVLGIFIFIYVWILISFVFSKKPLNPFSVVIFTILFISSLFCGYLFGLIGRIIISEDGIAVNNKKYSWRDLEILKIKPPAYLITTTLDGKYYPTATLIFYKKLFGIKRKLYISADFVDNFDDLINEIMQKGNLIKEGDFLYKKRSK